MQLAVTARPPIVRALDKALSSAQQAASFLIVPQAIGSMLQIPLTSVQDAAGAVRYAGADPRLPMGVARPTLDAVAALDQAASALQAGMIGSISPQDASQTAKFAVDNAVTALAAARAAVGGF